MFGHRQELDMRKTHLPHVINQRPRQLPVAERLRHRFLPPRTEVHFVNAHRRRNGFAFRRCFSHRRSVHLNFVVPDDRGVLRRQFIEEPKWIGLQCDLAMDAFAHSNL